MGNYTAWIVFWYYCCPGMTLNSGLLHVTILSWDDVKLRPLSCYLRQSFGTVLVFEWQFSLHKPGFFIFFFIPHPAEFGAEEFSLAAVPMLGLVRIGLGGGIINHWNYGSK